MKPLITIITATSNIIENNRQQLFLQAVDSIKTQSYQNIEYIIIDNNSTDGTIDILKQQKLIYYSEPDNGIYDAFNKGVQYAKGKYILFLNSDDYLHSKYGIEKAIALLEEKHCDYCFSECNFIINNHIFQWEPNIYSAFRQMPFCHQTLICTKKLLEKYPFDTSYKIIADYKFVLTLILNKISYCELKYNFVTFRLGGISNKDSSCLNKTKYEGERLIREITSTMYNLSNEEYKKAKETGIYPKQLEDKMIKYFDNKKLYKECLNEIYAVKTNSIPKNILTKAILSYKTDSNSNNIDALLNKFQPALSNIYKKLYKNLKTQDKKIFVKFFLKRFANIDTVSENQKQNLNKLFTKTFNLYQKRKNTDEKIPVKLYNKTAYIISPTPIYKDKPSKEEELIKYYEYVHSYSIKEYIKKGYEPESGKTIIDCGAFIGDTTILLKLKYPDSKIIAIESDKNNFEYLKKNIKINNFKNVYPINKFLNNNNNNNNITIDKIVEENNLKDIGLIKFDIEGAERFALEGAKNTILEQKPILIIPIYHLPDDCYQIPKILTDLNLPMQWSLKWVEKRIYGMDCSLFVKFI